MSRYIELGFNKGTNTIPRFSYTMLHRIYEGIEGPKGIVRVRSRRGIHGTYFMKNTSRPDEPYSYDPSEEAPIQKDMYVNLKRAQIPVPPIFKIYETKSNNGILATDLSENGKNFVYAYGNNSDPLGIKSGRLGTEVYERLNLQFVDICEKANAYSIIVKFDAYMIVINKRNPQQCAIYIADLGGVGTDDPKYVKPEYNFLEANDFSKSVLNMSLILPDNHPYAHLNHSFKKKFSLPFESPMQTFQTHCNFRRSAVRTRGIIGSLFQLFN